VDAERWRNALAVARTPAWFADGQSITSAANMDGTPHMFRISLDGATVSLVPEYSVDPMWSPGGDFLVHSGADIGTTFPGKAVSAAASPYPLPNLMLTRGARRLRFFQGRRALVGDPEGHPAQEPLADHLATGAERQLTNLAPDFNVRDFEVSSDGSEIVLERVQERSDVVLIDLARRN
jgi:hypothetical protein